MNKHTSIHLYSLSKRGFSIVSLPLHLYFWLNSVIYACLKTHLYLCQIHLRTVDSLSFPLIPASILHLSALYRDCLNDSQTLCKQSWNPTLCFIKGTFLQLLIFFSAGRSSFTPPRWSDDTDCHLNDTERGLTQACDFSLCFPCKCFNVAVNNTWCNLYFGLIIWVECVFSYLFVFSKAWISGRMR